VSSSVLSTCFYELHHKTGSTGVLVFLDGLLPVFMKIQAFPSSLYADVICAWKRWTPPNEAKMIAVAGRLRERFRPGQGLVWALTVTCRSSTPASSCPDRDGALRIAG